MSIQGSVNQLLGIGAAVAKVGTEQAAQNYAATRGAEYNKAYQAQVDAAKNRYTKSGALSKSKAAVESQAAADAAQPGAASKMPWNKGVEAQLKAQYDTKMADLGKTEAKGVKSLKETAKKAKEATTKQFGDYADLSPKLLQMMSPEDRWKVKAKGKIMQRKAFDDFVESINKRGEQ